MVVKKKTEKKVKKVAAKKRAVKEKDVAIVSDDLNLWELATIEKERDRGNAGTGGDGVKYRKELFRSWLALPDVFKGAPERVVSTLGIEDPVLSQLLLIKTAREFAEEFGVKEPALSRWRKDVTTKDDIMVEVKRQMKMLTKNVIGTLYRKILTDGDAQRVKLYLQYVDDWREQLGVEHSGNVSNLSPEEMAELDKLIEDNTV